VGSAEDRSKLKIKGLHTIGHNLLLAAVKIQRFEQHSVRYKTILLGTKVLTNSYGLSCQTHQVVEGEKNGTGKTQIHKVTYYVQW
jgi:hypothetical protein